MCRPPCPALNETTIPETHSGRPVMRTELTTTQEVANIFAALIVGTNALHMLAGAFAAMAMARHQMQGAKLVNAQTPAVGGPLAIQAANGTVFLGKQRVGRFLPGLGPPQPDLVAMQNFT